MRPWGKTLVLFLAIMAMVCVSFVAAAGPAQAKEIVKLDIRTATIPNVTDVNDVVYGDGKYVAICNGNTLLYSDNGLEWNRSVFSGFAPRLYGLAYKTGIWIAIGPNCTMLISHDGMNWTWCTSRPNTTKHLYTMTTGADRFVGVLSDGSIIWSKDAEKWSLIERDPTKPFNPTRIKYGAGGFVIFGCDNDHYAKQLTSADGEKWEEIRTTWVSSVTGILWGNNVFLIAGADAVSGSPTFYTSLDGKQAKPCANVPRTWSGMVYTFGDGCFWGIDPYQIYWTKDGSKWNSQVHDYPSNWYSLLYGNGQVLAFANNGKVLIFKTAPFRTDLASLKTSTGTFSPAFKPEETKYTLNVPPGSVTLEGLPAGSQAAVRFESGAKSVSGTTTTFDVKQDTTIRITVSNPVKDETCYEIAVKCAKPTPTAVLAKQSPAIGKAPKKTAAAILE
ncbi:MAG: cadherin-like beta sandwich domain-containing protein [Solirubrobacterales bacterium]